MMNTPQSTAVLAVIRRQALLITISLLPAILQPFAVESSQAAASLTDIYHLALEQDPELRANQAMWRAQREASYIARAALLPQLSASASYRDSDGERETVSEINGTTQLSELEQDRLSYTVVLNQALFSAPDWFRSRQASKLRRRADVLLAEEQQKLIQRAVNAYFEVLRAERALQLTKAEEMALYRQSQRTQDRFDAGLTAVTDVLEAQATYDAVTASRLALETVQIEAEQNLTRLTGSEHQPLRQLSAKLPIRAPEPPDISLWTERALENNYGLRAARLATMAARQQYNAARGEHLPRLSGTVSRNWDEDRGSGLPPFLNDESDTALISLDVPLYSGGRQQARRRQAYQEWLQARETEAMMRREVLSQIRTLLASLQLSVRRIAARDQAVRSSDNALRSIRDGYETGTRELFDVIRAEQNLYRTQRELSDARFNFVIDSVRFKALCGVLQVADLGSIDRYLRDP